MIRADIVAFATRDRRFIEDEKRRFWVRRKRDLTPQGSGLKVQRHQEEPSAPVLGKARSPEGLPPLLQLRICKTCPRPALIQVPTCIAANANWARLSNGMSPASMVMWCASEHRIGPVVHSAYVTR